MFSIHCTHTSGEATQLHNNQENTDISVFGKVFFYLAPEAFINSKEQQEIGAGRAWGRHTAKGWGAGFEPATTAGRLALLYISHLL